MTTNANIQDALDVWEKLYNQNGAVPEVIKANQVWLAALEQHLEPSASDEKVRQKLDELTFLRFADRKLDGHFSQIDTSSESFENELSNLLKETEAYLVMTNESYEHLIIITDGVPKEAREAAQNARKDLDKVVKDHSALISRPVETELPRPATGTGTELLLEKGSYLQDRLFLKDMSAGTDEYGWTTDLLAEKKFDLKTDEIKNLTNSWGEVIKKAASGSPLSSLFRLHNTLEKLYELLATNVTRKDADILSIDI